MIRFAALPLALVAAGPAAGEVVQSSERGFTVEHKLRVAAPPAQLWQQLIRPAAWWSSAHTYSGGAANLSLDARAGGCWCERTAKGGVEHMRVVQIAEGEMLRLTGGLGPLQAMPVAGVLTFTLKPVAGGTELSLRYAVAGEGAAALAAPVDQVLGAQLPALKAAAEQPLR